MPKREWYRIRAATNGAAPETADIYIYDVIGDSWFEDSVSAKQFLDELRAIPDSVKTLRVHVNSPGGDPFDATAIFNMLRAQAREKGRTIEVLVEGLAASAATIVTSAGDTIKIAKNALMMVHKPWGFAVGNADDMMDLAATLETIEDSIVASYQAHSPKTADELKALMRATTWMTAEQAVANGFATEIVDAAAVAASIDPRSLRALGAIPDHLRERIGAFTKRADDAPPVPAMEPAMPATDVLDAVEQARLPVSIAKEMIAAGTPPEQARTRIAALAQDRDTRDAREAEVRAACTLAGFSELADGYVRSALSPKDVGAHLTIVTASASRGEIVHHLPPDGGPTKPRARLNPNTIYAERNHAGATPKEG